MRRPSLRLTSREFFAKIVAHRPIAHGRKAAYGSYRVVDNGHEAGSADGQLAGEVPGREAKRSALINREPKKVQATPLNGLPMRSGL